MTSRELFQQYVCNPFPEVGKEYERDTYEHCLSLEMAKHINHAQVEGKEYFSRAIAKLRHEIADEAVSLYNYWCRVNDRHETFGVSDLSGLLDWIDFQLNSCDNESRPLYEKTYGHELFAFVFKMALINRLQARLDAIGDEGASEKEKVALELLHALTEDVFWKSTTIDTPNKGVVKCTDEAWLALCGLLPKTSDIRIEWLVQKNDDRYAMPLAELLIEMFGAKSAQDKIGLFVDHRGKMKWDNNFKLRHQNAKNSGTTERNIYFRDIRPKISLILERWNCLK